MGGMGGGRLGRGDVREEGGRGRGREGERGGRRRIWSGEVDYNTKKDRDNVC